MFIGQLKYVLLFLGFVFLHELGHIITLLLFKGQVNRLTLTIVGGIVDINDEYLSSWQRLIVYLSGITMNGLMIFLITKINVQNELKNIMIAYNKLMITFNLLPIYPLDGFQIIEVFLNCFFDYEYASEVSGLISAIFLVLLSLYGMISKSSAIIIISIFLLLKVMDQRKWSRLNVTRQTAHNYAFLRQLRRSF